MEAIPREPDLLPDVRPVFSRRARVFILWLSSLSFAGIQLGPDTLSTPLAYVSGAVLLGGGYLYSRRPRPQFATSWRTQPLSLALALATGFLAFRAIAAAVAAIAALDDGDLVLAFREATLAYGGALAATLLVLWDWPWLGRVLSERTP